MNPLFGHAVEFVSDTVHRFYGGKEIDRVVERFAGDFSWIGAGEIEFSTDSAGIVSYLVERAPLAPPCDVSEEEFHLVNVTDRTCTVMGRYRVRTGAESGMVLEEHQRCSYELVDDGGSLKIRHVHVSNPYQAMKDEPYFPFEAGTQSYEYLQQLLREKTEMIDLITKNTNGGLKVSEDDDLYTFAYVNEGLAGLLGYTVDEFMEMSGGTAVGAVYPPDLENALGDVARCFASGPTYETEYRIRKKDGTLAWVLDSGRKVPLADGTVKINSVIMDITSRKTIEEELRLEQERYRVALRSVTDVLFEYEVETDTLVEFRRPEGATDENPLQERRIPGYSSRMKDGFWLVLEDFKRLPDMLEDGQTATFDVRRSSIEPGARQGWVRLHVMMVRDPAGKPVRVIGSWKDVTDERSRIEELEDRARRDPLTKLYNQVAANDLVGSALADCLARGTGVLYVIDVDDFKTVNDTVGHLVGDDLLVEVARAIEGTFADNGGIAARVGGDEFLAFLPTADRDRAVEVSGDLSDAVRDIRISGRRVTLSVGMAMVGEDGDSYELLFEAGDRALYRAKREGKDRTEFADGAQ